MQRPTHYAGNDFNVEILDIQNNCSKRISTCEFAPKTESIIYIFHPDFHHCHHLSLISLSCQLFDWLKELKFISLAHLVIVSFENKSRRSMTLSFIFDFKMLKKSNCNCEFSNKYLCLTWFICVVHTMSAHTMYIHCMNLIKYSTDYLSEYSICDF
jgi:hypothetical protein